jgi:hypothetical protein
MSGKAKAQFVQVPSLERVRQIFSFVTGQPFEPHVSWSTWRSPSQEDFAWVRAYIRPCHQKILNDTVAGENPCRLMRQLLRPYDYYIDAKAGMWSLRSGHVEKGVRECGEKSIEWV